ncbi:MAG TPA: hypothetical protein VLC54_04235 [Anaeromyxobacter sp.]|nr:hypothetical protein [Anaeromyxobacter sp.]
MSPADRLLASLAAAIVPERAAALLARLGSADAGQARAHAERLAPTSRAERLSAVAAALAAVHTGAPERPAASCERARVGGVLLCLRRGLLPHAAVAPALVRICRQLLGP